MNDRVLQPLNAFFDALDLGLQQVPKIVKAFVHSVPKVVDAAILKEKAKQVATYYHGETPLIHTTILCDVACALLRAAFTLL